MTTAVPVDSSSATTPTDQPIILEQHLYALLARIYDKCSGKRNVPLQIQTIRDMLKPKDGAALIELDGQIYALLDVGALKRKGYGLFEQYRLTPRCLAHGFALKKPAPAPEPPVRSNVRPLTRPAKRKASAPKPRRTKPARSVDLKHAASERMQERREQLAVARQELSKTETALADPELVGDLEMHKTLKTRETNLRLTIATLESELAD